MKDSKRWCRLVASMLLVGAMFAACSEPDTSIGSDFLPDDQELTIGKLNFNGYTDPASGRSESVISTRLFKSDGINASSRRTSDTSPNGIFGVQYDERFGERRSGFYTQYVPMLSLNEDGYGYKPVVDSVLIYLNVDGFGGDTTVSHRYFVYEVMDDSFISNSADTLFRTDYEYPAGTFSAEPVFSFVFPDQANKIYTSSTKVRAEVTKSGVDLIDRLLLRDVDYTIYNKENETKFRKIFKGLYVALDEEQLTNDGKNEGATYSVDLLTSGFGFYTRSVYEEDPSIVRDTLAMTYVFQMKQFDSWGYDAGITRDMVSINNVSHDYSQSQVDLNLVKSSENPNVPSSGRIMVEGMGGISTEVTLERPMFEEFERVIEEAGDGYRNLFFNTARMSLYLESVEKYDSEFVLSTDEEIDNLNAMPSILGLYSNYSSFAEGDNRGMLEGVADYNYAYELYGYITDLNGMFNRSTGCYTQNIPMQLQSSWNSYLEAKREAGGDASAIDWDAAEWNKVYIAPQASKLFTTRYATMQGEANDENGAPVRIQIVYTLIK